MVYVIVIILVVIAFLLLIFFGIVWSVAYTNSPESNVKSLKSFLGFDFKSQYNVISYISNGFHPDSPVKIAISLSDTDFGEVKCFIDTVELSAAEKISNDGKVRYIDAWRREGNIYVKIHSATDVVHNRLFFVASLEINCDNNTLKYEETGF